ncbi:hypothetical protein JCM10450v2_007470 [Rhodotorula kratochvilovae]
MAGGSLVARTKTRTRTSTASTSSSRHKSRPSTSSGTRRKLVPSSSSSDEAFPAVYSARGRRGGSAEGQSSDSDFARDMQRQADHDARAAADKYEAARLRAERKKYTDRGEAVPLELRARRKKSAGGAPKPRVKDDEDGVIAFVSAERRKDLKGKSRAMESSEDEGSVKATRPTFRRSGKRREVERAQGLHAVGADSSDEEGADDVMDALRGAGDLSDDPDEVKRHLARRWVNKKNPNAMSARRKQLEEKYNPLVRMLKVKIQVVSGPAHGADSDDERRHAQDAHALNITDPDTDWSSDGMGEHNGKIPAHPKRASSPPPRGRVKTESPSPQKVFKLEYDEMSNVKPQVTPSTLPPFPLSKGKSPEDVKPVITLSDDEREPSTAESDDDAAATASGPVPSTPADIKPFALLASRTASTSFAPVPAPVASSAAVPMAIDAPADADEADSGAEPDTEPSTDEDDDDHHHAEISPPRASAAPHFAAHTHSSQTAFASSQLLGSLKAEGGTQTQASSLALSQQRGVKAEAKEEDADLGSDVEFVDDAMLRGVEAAAREKRAREERRRAEERRREVQRELAERRRVKEEEREEVDEEDEDEEGELLMWDVGKGVQTRIWPQPVRKGRPKFLLESAQQASMGAHYLSKDKGDKTQIPAPLNRFLRQYQREGAEFLYSQYKKGMGGILGDDMGLGKTIQVIAFLSAVMNKQGLKKYDAGKRKDAINARAPDDPVDLPSDLGPTCLIVCPTTVVHNWEREFHTWGYFDVGVFAGAKKQAKMDVLRRFDLGYLDVVIAGIEGVRNHIDEFKARDFTIVVVDEAHRLKNRKSGTTIAMNQLGSRLRYGLTGTAMQNQLGEFWCLLNWAVPGRVGTHRQWDDLVSRPLKFAQAADATEEELALGRSRAVALVTSLLPNFWLRRTKEAVKLQLPPKTDNVVLCPLTPLQQRVYRRLLELEDVQIMLTADEPCPCGETDENGARYRRGSCCEQEWTKLIFKYISLFQGVSNHLALMYPNREDKRKDPERYEQACSWMQVAFPDDWRQRKPGPQAALDPDLCGKWKILCELLDLWHREGHKVLIFSMSLKILDLLAALMETTHYKYLTLDGSTPQDDRMPLVDEFNDPAGEVFCFLISTRAGGVGLNLTAADRVVIFDPNWNPAHDLQAMDRAYRFGQTRKVDVYRLIGAGTLEELIYNRQQYKRAMAKTSYDATAERRLYTGVQGEGKSQHGDLWGVKNIFTLSDNFSLTEKSIEKANLAELEYALRNSSIFETEDGKVADLDEPDADEVVAEVTGYSKKAEPTNQMSLEELARHEKHLHEQATIARILSGVKTTESDAVIGGSSIEMLRGHNAIRGQAAAAAKPPPPPPPPPAAKAKKKRSKTADDDEDLPAWDPLSRGKPKGEPALKKPKIEPGGAGGLFAAEGLPEHVSAVEVLQAAGYVGAEGVQRFRRELEAGGSREKRAKVQGAIRSWRKANEED